MKKIVIFTSSEVRHIYFRIFLSNCDGIQVLKTFSEEGRVLEKTFKEKDLRLNHFNERTLIEKEFFSTFIKNNKDLSNNFNCDTGYISSKECESQVKLLEPDLIVVYGSSILKGNLIDLFKNKILNVHLGLSPYYRGSGTNYFPFVNNEAEYAGATFMFLDKGIDTGKVIHQIRSRIKVGDSFHVIGNRLIKDMVNIYSQLIINFEKIDKSLPDLSEKNKKRYSYKRNDFTVKSLKELKKQLSNQMIESYLSNREDRDNKVPLITQNFIKEIDYNQT